MKREEKKYYRELFIHVLRKLSKKRRLQPVYRGSLNSVVILASERYGDVILLTPLIKNLRTAFPGISIHIIAFKKSIYEFLRYDPHITKVYYAKGAYITYAKDVLFRKFDLLFNPKDAPSFNFLLQSVLISARFKTGHRHDLHAGLYDYLISTDYNSHVSQRNCALLQLLEVPLTKADCLPYLPPMPVSQELHDFAHQLDSCSIAGINISASTGDKYWHSEKWSELLDAFGDQKFVVLSAPKDIGIKKKLEQEHDNVLFSPGTKNLFEAGEIIKRLKVLVSPDTSLVHVASCYNTSLIGLYRNRVDSSRFRPLSETYDIILSPTERVADIAVEDVRKSVEVILAKCVR